MEAPNPATISNETFILNKSCNLDGESYLIKVGKTEQGNEIKIFIDSEDNCSKEYFSINLNYENFYNLGKSFRQCDTLEEILTSLTNIFKDNKNSFSIFLSDKTNDNIILSLKTILISGKEEVIKIKLKKVQKDKDLVINNLLKQIDNLVDYSLKLKGMDSIIRNLSHLNFIEENIIKKIEVKENQKILYKLLYKASKDGDNGKIFHEKCDNFSPTLSIIKTNNNLIFGGFTSQTWNCNKSNKNDNKAFCFQVNKKKIYNIIKDKYAIYCGNSYGPSFWDGKSKGTAHNFKLSEDYNNNLRIVKF